MAVGQPFGHGPAHPAEWVTHTASATQKPRTSRDSPSSGMLSVVKENRPLTPSSRVACSAAGSSARVSAQAGAKSSPVNGSTEGMTSASATGRISSGVIGIGRWP